MGDGIHLLPLKCPWVKWWSTWDRVILFQMDLYRVQEVGFIIKIDDPYRLLIIHTLFLYGWDRAIPRERHLVLSELTVLVYKIPG